MTSKERVLAAIGHKVTDRVPITFDAEQEVYEAVQNHLRVDSKEALFDRLHVDTWMILPENFVYPEEEAGREIKISIWGYKTKVTHYSGGFYDQLCFSPAAFKEFVMPYLTKMVERVHRHNKKFLLHVCGAVRPLLPMIIDAGVDMLEPIQIRAEGMDLQQILCNGRVEQVAQEVRRLIDILGKDGGYVFGPGHTYIQIDAPVETIMRMYETAYRYRPWS